MNAISSINDGDARRLCRYVTRVQLSCIHGRGVKTPTASPLSQNYMALIGPLLLQMQEPHQILAICASFKLPK